MKIISDLFIHSPRKQACGIKASSSLRQFVISHNRLPFRYNLLSKHKILLICKSIKWTYIWCFAFCLLLIFITLPCLGQQKIQKNLCCYPRDIVFIIDESQTMFDNDPERDRWKIIEYATNYFRRCDNGSDRIAIIPFGDSLNIQNYVNEIHSRQPNPDWYNFGADEEWEIFKKKLKGQIRYKEKIEHTATTHILSAFQYFSKHFDIPNDKRDIYIFFISDGKVDLFDPDIPEEHLLTNKHDEKLMALLDQNANRWRLYCICLGQNVKVNYHERMLKQINVTDLTNGRSYPVFQETIDGKSFLLEANSSNRQDNINKMKRGITDVLGIGSSREMADSTYDNNIVIPGRGSVNLQLRFVIKPKIDIDVLKSKIFVSFTAKGTPREVEIEPKKAGDNGSNERIFCDFSVNVSKVLQSLSQINCVPEDIEQWKISVQPMQNHDILDIDILYEHGWRLKFDTLYVELDIPKKRNPIRRLFGIAEPCKPILHIRVEGINECGDALSDSTAKLIVGNPKNAYPLKVKRVSITTDDGQKYKYIWFSDPIKNDLLIKSRLGELINVEVVLLHHRYIFKNGSLYVPLFADYQME